MHLITLQLSGPAGVLLDPELLAELIDSHSEASDRLEHLRARSAPGRVDLALFLLADDELAADRAARAVCRRAIERTHWLTAWQLHRR
ncbi:hypothetical protein ABT095_13145 [Kitasatospora sp. NPDC002227]|uniref:hypothetical protein n=1 Tax=Kitasatospora sp. NPDC002227 TaxID=3154773 RepID=UPI00332795E6